MFICAYRRLTSSTQVGLGSDVWLFCSNLGQHGHTVRLFYPLSCLSLSLLSALTLMVQLVELSFAEARIESLCRCFVRKLFQFLVRMVIKKVVLDLVDGGF